MKPAGVAVLRRDDWQVLNVPEHSEVVRFIKSAHYAKGAPNTSTYRHGLYETRWNPFRGDLFGVALWLPPTRRAAESVAGDGWEGVLCLSRLAVSPEVPQNGASFLLGQSMARINRERWPYLLTYADTALGHTGAIYKATNWRSLGEVDAGDVWLDANGQQWGRKRGRRSLTVDQMRARGLERKPNAKKLKFVHFDKGGGPSTRVFIKTPERYAATR